MLKVIKSEKREIVKVEPAKINSLLKLFEVVNLTVNYGNKTSRKNAEILITKLGYEQALKVVEMVMSIQGEIYAPTVSTPTQLVAKWNALKAYFKRNESNKIREI